MEMLLLLLLTLIDISAFCSGFLLVLALRKYTSLYRAALALSTEYQGVVQLYKTVCSSHEQLISQQSQVITTLQETLQDCLDYLESEDEDDEDGEDEPEPEEPPGPSGGQALLVISAKQLVPA